MKYINIYSIKFKSLILIIFLVANNIMREHQNFLLTTPSTAEKLKIKFQILHHRLDIK